MKKATAKKATIELNKGQRKSCEISGRVAKKADKSVQRIAAVASVASTQSEMEDLRDYWCALSQAAAEECQRLTDELNLMP